MQGPGSSGRNPVMKSDGKRSLEVKVFFIDIYRPSFSTTRCKTLLYAN